VRRPLVAGAEGIAGIEHQAGQAVRTELPLLTASGAFAVSYLAGLLALAVPGGLVVRETIFIVLLRPFTGFPAAVALAIASRVLMTGIELSLALPAALQRPPGAPQAPTPSQ